MRCIYCKKDIKEDNKSHEHVFPRSFGCPDSWAMDCVCIGCNNEFGRTIERYLASDSIEGLWRLQKLGSLSKKPIRQTRIQLNIPDEYKYGEFRGAIVYVDFSKRDSLLLPPQVLIIDSQGNRKFFLIDDINEEVKKELQRKDKGYWVFANNINEQKTTIEKLKQAGVEFKPIKEVGFPAGLVGSDGKLEVAIEEIKDQVIFRAIAKIAFNYLAKVKGADYALDARFDTVREYIKNGAKPNFNIVRIEKGHILAEETNSEYFFEGHIFTIQTKGDDIIGKVSLSNTFSFYYVVRLGELGPIWHDLKRGHAYSFEEDKIIPLFSPTFLTIKTKLAKLLKIGKFLTIVRK